MVDPALVLIEYQNEFTTDGGVLHAAVAPVMDKTGTLTDCTAATSPEEHDNAITYDYPMFSLPMEAAEVTADV
ncbi:MAG: ureidoacrylate peracid hydrolase [Actinoplanes sp.]|nr:ureidoacrylate peracid hydrolase [Actinoplanes sp.]